ncbi:MAG: hypothetical protein IJC84_00035 [Clostridia bacterium]|nr:hypothetical protein [Clostridia bacterium]
MKRIFTMILVGILLLPSLFSCGTEAPQETLTTSETEEIQVQPVVLAEKMDVPSWESIRDIRPNPKRGQVGISTRLRDEMSFHGSADTVYRVFVEILITAEDFSGFQLNDEYSKWLREEYRRVIDEYNKAYDAANAATDPEEKASALAVKEEKRELRDAAINRYETYQRYKYSEYLDSLINYRLTEAAALSDTPPVRHSPQDSIKLYYAYQGHGYYMELTAEDITALAYKGVYSLRLAGGDYTPEDDAVFTEYDFFYSGTPADKAE